MRRTCQSPFPSLTPLPPPPSPQDKEQKKQHIKDLALGGDFDTIAELYGDAWVKKAQAFLSRREKRGSNDPVSRGGRGWEDEEDEEEDHDPLGYGRPAGRSRGSGQGSRP
jgi:hypothetical protein